MKNSQFKNIYAPIGGWNTTSSVADMDSKEAIVLDNIIPSTGSAVGRKGYTEYATDVGAGPVESLFELKAGNVNKFIAAGEGSFFDISTTGSATSIKSGFNNDRWYGAVFNGQLGLVNGFDIPQVYDGTTMSPMTVSNVTPADINFIFTFKNRTYFILNNSQSFWYSDLNVLGGALTEFPLGNVGTFGGNLMTMETLTRDGGNGQEDLLCFFMTTGEIIIYSGTDPSTNFVLTGIYQAGRPVSPRAIKKFGADIFMVNNEGYFPISSLLPLSYGKTNSGISKKIQGAADEALMAGDTLTGWEVCLCPSESFLLVNVPVIDGSYVQHVLNSNTLQWCRFTGIPSYCWAVFNNTLYFGGSGTVYSYGPEYTDDGGNITAEYTSPYFNFNTRPVKFAALRPRIKCNSTLSISYSQSADFNPYTLPSTTNYGIVGARWGVPELSPNPPWGSPWSTATVTNLYKSLPAIATNLSVRLTMEYNDRIEFLALDLLYEKGWRI